MGKRIGLLVSDGEFVKGGTILVRQRGTKFHPSRGVKKADDDSLVAKISGYVKIKRTKTRKYIEIIKDAAKSGEK